MNSTIYIISALPSLKGEGQGEGGISLPIGEGDL